MKKTVKIYTVLLCGLAAVCLGGLLFGSVPLSPGRLWQAVIGSDTTASVILWKLRLPRVLAAGLAGIGLAAAGDLLQRVTNNDLCAPSIIGVNAGAGLGVMLILCLAPSFWALQPLAAFAGALFTSLAVIAISAAGSRFGRRSSLILAGVAFSSLLNAGISLLSLLYPDALSSYMAFSVGGFSGVRVAQLALPACVIAVCLAVIWLVAPKVELLCLGEEAASCLGVNVPGLRMLCIVVASALCAAAVSFAGLLGFVGLMVPHIVRRFLHTSMRRGMPAVALFGAILVILSDVGGRTLFAPYELPAGILMAALGAPFFIWLLVRKRGGANDD